MILDTITLPDDLLWINEFEWNPRRANDRAEPDRGFAGSGRATHPRQANHSLWQWRGRLGFTADGQEPVCSLQSG